MKTREAIIADYLDYVNNYLSAALWGEHRGLSEVEAMRLLAVYGDIFNDRHPDA
jgi:hypothetical protein